MGATDFSTPRAPRKRRFVPAWVLVALRPLFRYSASRDAFVLRAIGNSRGPVLRRDRRSERRRAGGLVTE